MGLLQYIRLTIKRRPTWLPAMGKDPLKGGCSESSYVCSDHFSEEDYKTQEKKRKRTAAHKTEEKKLKTTAVPHLNMTAPEISVDKTIHKQDNQDESLQEILTVKVEPELCLNVNYEDELKTSISSEKIPNDYIDSPETLTVKLEPGLCENIICQEKEMIKEQVASFFKSEEIDDGVELPSSIENVVIKTEPTEHYVPSEESNMCQEEAEESVENCTVDRDIMFDQHSYQAQPFLPNEEDDFEPDILENQNQSGKLVCNVCEGLFKSKKTLKKHSLLHLDHSDMEQLSCDQCPYKATSKYLYNRHLKMHDTEGEYTCEYCNYKTKFDPPFRSHMKVQHGVTLEKINKCPFCSFETKHTLTVHLKIHMDETQLVIYRCDVPKCTFKSKYKQSLETHKLMHADLSDVPTYKCEKCKYETKIKKYLTKHRSWAHKELNDIPQIKCDLCPYTARNQSIMRLHLLRHANPEEITMFKCALCPYENRFKKNLRNHLITHKKLEQKINLNCPHCTYVANEKRFLNRHILWFHTNDSANVKIILYKCTECPFETNRKTNLKKHMFRMHDVIDFPEEFESHEASNTIKTEPSCNTDLEQS